MTLVSLPTPIPFPGLMFSASGGPTVTTAATLDASGEYIAYVFCAKETMAISHIGFRAGTSTGSPTCTVSVETLDGSGLPSGTLWNSPTNTTTAVTATISSNTWVLTALGGTASITKGQAFCIKIAYTSGTSQLTQALGSVLVPSVGNFPYQVVNAGTPTKGTIAAVPMVALGSSSTTFYNVPGIMAFNSYASGAFNNTSSAKRGLRFVPPMNCRAIGIRWYGSNNVGDYNALLMNDGGTELSSSSTAFDGDLSAANTGAINTAYFDNAVTLTAGTAYRVAIEPTSATNCNVSTITLPSVDYFSSTPASSSSVATYASFATATWTDSTTQLPFMDVLLDQVDDGAGGGGGGVVPYVIG